MTYKDFLTLIQALVATYVWCILEWDDIVAGIKFPIIKNSLLNPEQLICRKK